MGIPVWGFFVNVIGNDHVRSYMLELVDCGNLMPKVVVGTIFIVNIVGSMMVIIYLHSTHNRHQDVFGERKTHHK